MKSNNYKTEARSRWGNTDAYREHEQKTKNYTKEKWAEANDGLMAIFAEFALCKDKGVRADSTESQALVAKLQAHISPPTTTPAQTRFLRGLVRCMLPTSASKITLISTATERLNSLLKQYRYSVRRN